VGNIIKACNTESFLMSQGITYTTGLSASSWKKKTKHRIIFLYS